MTNGECKTVRNQETFLLEIISRGYWSEPPVRPACWIQMYHRCPNVLRTTPEICGGFTGYFLFLLIRTQVEPESLLTICTRAKCPKMARQLLQSCSRTKSSPCLPTPFFRLPLSFQTDCVPRGPEKLLCSMEDYGWEVSDATLTNTWQIPLCHRHHSWVALSLASAIS